MTHAPEHLSGKTVHARFGPLRNSFSYGVDFVLIDPEDRRGPLLFSRNRFNLFSVHDRDHGGPRGDGRGASWARDIFAQAGLTGSYDLRLLTQPAYAGVVFNPVSFWLALRGDGLLAVIAEVNNTFGDRHSYLCHRQEFAPITPTDQITARKVFHVSPFQEIAGHYSFGFSIRPDRIAIRILHENGDEGLVATLSGPRRPLTNRAILGACLRRPFGAMRTVGLIYIQAVRLKLMGARYRTRPEPPTEEVSS
nr:DUF1365 domain-containing protein [uncultured Celeribacter sp.]